ncbi:MAG: hypothetical protein ABIX37_03865 [Gammaproteobacteria bacterium]
MTTGDQEPPPTLLRTAKGRRPQYFDDPAVDKLLAIVTTLIGEVSVLRDRLDTIEQIIEQQGLFPRSAIDSFQPNDTEVARRDARRADYLARVFRIIQNEIEELGGDRQMAPLEEVIEQFAKKKL